MNVVIISLDCVRPEALSCYPESFPYQHRVPYRADTPRIDEIAANGLRFRNAFCQAPFTPSSHASLFTGKNPYRHGIRGMFDYRLADNVKTIAERFSAAGFDTGGFIGAHALSSRYGLDRGFDVFDEEFDAAADNWVVGNRRPGWEVTSRALDWLGDRATEYFLFLHYFDAHDGGHEPAEDDEGGEGSRSDGLRALYDDHLRSLDESLGSPVKRLYRTVTGLGTDEDYGRRYHLQQVQQIDEQIGRVIDALRDRGEYQETTIVVLADHGDAFGEHGEYGHREYLYDTTLRVPLLVKPAADTEIEPGTHEGVVRSIDVAPTLAATADLTWDEGTGESLYAAVRAPDEERRAYAETRYERSPDALDDLVTDLEGLRSHRWKLIRDRLDDSVTLYDLGHDPGERSDVADRHPDVRADLEEDLDDLLAGAPGKDDSRLTDSDSAAIRDHLEGLGYL